MRKYVSDLVKDSAVMAQKDVGVYNPMFDPFEIEYEGQKYTAEPQAITTFPPFVAKYLKKHLRDHIINERGYQGSIYDEREKVEQEISV